MRKATELMVQYAAYHRDRRNILSHFVGVPLIVFAIGVLLAFRSGVRGWFAPLRHADPHEASAHDHAPAGAP
jgi:hypothetical protein